MYGLSNDGAGKSRQRDPVLSVLISAMRGTAHLPKLIAACKQLAPMEIIVVSPIPLELGSGYRVIHTENGKNPFAWRSLGAKHAKGNVLLFLGEEQIYSFAGLQRFLFPIVYGNAYAVLSMRDHREKRMTPSKPIHSFSLLMNELYGRTDLREASLLDTPHALKKEAVCQIGMEQLAYPARAHRLLAVSGLSVVTQIMLPEHETQLFLPEYHGSLRYELSCHEQLVIHEQMELIKSLPFRGNLSDGSRQRETARQVINKERSMPVTQAGAWPLRKNSLNKGQTLSVIIPAKSEEATIKQVIQEVLQLEPVEVIVVVNGAVDQTAQIARECGTTTVQFSQALGVDTGRAIGASLAKGDILLFVDADVIMTAHDLYPFVLACQRGVDVALNDVSVFLNQLHTNNVFVAARQALNLALNRKDLGIGSMVTVPFALRREAVAQHGWSLLLCPPKAHAAYAQAGARMELVHQVNSIASNRFRPDKHLASSGMPAAVEQIVGDHLEALQFLAERGLQKLDR